MSKKLTEMTLEELWELFPIFLTEPNKDWPKWFKEEKINLETIIPDNLDTRIHHIGSTAIDKIWAKPIIDILIEVPDKDSLFELKKSLLNNNYICMNESETRISFNKGYTENGFAQKVFHIHLRLIGDHDEIYFRDYLNNNYEVAKEYEKLKIELWKKFEHNRDKYTDMKSDFVKKYTNRAKELASEN